MIVEFAGIPGCGKTTTVTALCEHLQTRGVDVTGSYVGQFDLREAAIAAGYLATHPTYWPVAASVRSRRASVMFGSFLRRERRRHAAEEAALVLMDEGPVNGAAMLAASGGPVVRPLKEADLTVLIELDPDVAAERTKLRWRSDPGAIVSSPEYLTRFAAELELVIDALGCTVVRETNDAGLVERLAARISGPCAA